MLLNHFVSQVVRIFQFSSKRNDRLSSQVDQLVKESGEYAPVKRKLTQLCRTSWIERHMAFEAFLDLFEAVCTTIRPKLSFWWHVRVRQTWLNSNDVMLISDRHGLRRNRPVLVRTLQRKICHWSELSPQCHHEIWLHCCPGIVHTGAGLLEVPVDRTPGAGGGYSGCVQNGGHRTHHNSRGQSFTDFCLLLVCLQPGLDLVSLHYQLQVILVNHSSVYRLELERTTTRDSGLCMLHNYVAASVSVTPMMLRVVRKQTPRDNAPAANQLEYFQWDLTTPFLDHVLSELRERCYFSSQKLV